MSKLITCPTCSHSISSDAKSCPQCGSPNKTKVGCFKIVMVLFVAFLVLIVVGSLAGGNKKAMIDRVGTQALSNIQWEEIDAIYNLRSKATDLQKDELWKNYEGKKVQWSGTVSSVGETFGVLQLQVKLSPQTLISDVLVSLDDASRSEAIKLQQGDPVTFQGILKDWGTLMPITLDYGVIIKK